MSGAARRAEDAPSRRKSACVPARESAIVASIPDQRPAAPPDMPHSIHIIGSQRLGGAESFFMRLVTALNARNHAALAVSRQIGRA
ncbi:MAG TPA: hypothetical protein ENK26_06080, partial [Gammaproteobacteria bacterium]|nr:hypothetical protein [Gammaproteobacteria bacterium]